MQDDSLTHDVTEWLQGTGYVLEMKVAQLISELGSELGDVGSVEQGYQYTDPVTGKLRETDVLWTLSLVRREAKGGRFHGRTITFVIECKNTNTPWVIFRQSKEGKAYRFALSIDIPDGKLPECPTCRGLFMKLTSWNYGTEEADAIGYAIREKRAKTNDRDLAREAVLASMSAGISLANNHESGDTVHSTGLILPVIVTASPLFAAELDKEGLLKLTRVTRHRLLGRHEKLDYPINVDVVTLESLNEYARDVITIHKNQTKMFDKYMEKLDSLSKEA